MSCPDFLMLTEDRVVLAVKSIVAVTELSEQDIDPRTGRLALGIPEGSATVIHTDRQTFYVKTEFDVIHDVLRAIGMGEHHG